MKRIVEERESKASSGNDISNVISEDLSFNNGTFPSGFD